MQNFTGSNPNGRKAEIRQSESPWGNGYSVFTWHDDGTGVIMCGEQHEMSWDAAFAVASDWLN